MYEFSKVLGDVVKDARIKMGLTQSQAAELAGIDVRTVNGIENYQGNPKLEVLYPLIRALEIDSHEIFNPEIHRTDPSIRRLRLLVAKCSEEESASLLPVVRAVLSALRSKTA